MVDGSPVDLSDSSIIGYDKTDGTLHVHVQLWTEKHCTLHFERTIGLLDCLAGDLDCVMLSESPSGTLATDIAKELSGNPAKVKHYRFVDPDGRASLEVVTENHAATSACMR